MDFFSAEQLHALKWVAVIVWAVPAGVTLLVLLLTRRR